VVNGTAARFCFVLIGECDRWVCIGAGDDDDEDWERDRRWPAIDFGGREVVRTISEDGRRRRGVREERCSRVGRSASVTFGYSRMMISLSSPSKQQ
jgi:hypothetical protein